MSSNLIRCQNGHLFSARRYGTVCPFCNIETATKEKKELGAAGADSEALEELLLAQEEIPVCGWLVCISGPRQGKDYKIRSGKNFIGRADDMDIQILGDNKISRRNHGVVVFDPKKRQTVLLPGDSNGLVYHNEAAVYTPTVLDSYDVIEMGDSRFVFVPFCGDNFMWEERGQGV
ncbi:FHA domain-containing protein [Clostridiaceae bacterium]|jgi:hypothetical protein|nr:FHA domain-containing protein [Clostridium sp.]NBI70141.1 FHA domain-containing protein [Clostridiaceae bacterium]